MKYQNISGFRATVVVGGSKKAVFQNEIIDYPGELIHPCFVKVADDVQANYKEKVVKRPSPQNDEKLSILEDKLTDVKKDTKNIANLEEAHSKTSDEIKELRQAHEDFRALAIKRMEILKSVLENLEDEVGTLMGYDDEEVKDVEAKDTKPFRKS
jgi:hypothetical protein